ncbi:MAG: SgcJ/EcaC family oxidoreductase [Erythrobacter sp.]|uniref:SgcJ/EcaC family oxidoreductase n=1 Tax=Erythrobacter sp. TaxID=1042 RepID=UPI0025FF2351|nr:SgcJ/EcaC family oxidoreductase [Erythrobacter sp.]MCL9998600.1 SgcJ/EcaC family oxidoreductase [Erythrobacter sp.]
MNAAEQEKRVRAVVDGYQTAWNASDMDAMRALYDTRVHWVNIVGMHWQGIADVDRAHRAYFDQMFRGVPITLEAIESIVPIGDGGSIAVIRWAVGAYRTPGGHMSPPGRNRMSLVLMPHGDELRILHGANVEIVAAAQAFDPITRKGD